jgi:filamentous hemagglutinin family protein
MTGHKIVGRIKRIAAHGLSFLIPFSLMSVGYANPVLNSVVSGNVSVQQSGNTVQINQTTERGIISWDTFNIAAGEKTNFSQPNASSVTLNRINSQMGPSLIFGQLSANGRIILINGAGLYFGPSAMVNVGSIIASTSNISNANFLAGKYIFDEPSSSRGSIINKGLISAADAGVVALLGAVIENDGLIRAHLGSVLLGSGSQFTLDFSGDQLITFAVTAPVSHGSVTNTGKIVADGGQVLVTAAAAQGVLDNVINMAGYVEARSSAKQRDGSIVLLATNGNVVVSGKLNVSGSRHNGNAGKISISGNNITLTKKAVIKANAVLQGSGGKVALVALNNLQAAGKISAKGGSVSGNGGSVDTSAANLDISSAKVNLLAAHGNTGSWLIDPADLTISNNPSSNLNIAGNTSTANQTSAIAVPNLNVADLERALASANIVVQTTNTGTGGSGDISVMNDITWASNSSLTLTAYRNITIDTGVTIANSGGATLVLRSDNSGTGIGTVNFNGSANVNFSAGGAVNIYYNPASYMTPVNYSSNVKGVTSTAYMLVNTAANLADINTNLAGDYALGNNINLTGNFTPIGSTATPYVGKFDGQGYTINGLQIIDATNNANIGLFGVTSGATISNVTLANVNITESANATTVAALVGFAVDTVFHNDAMTGGISVTTANNDSAIYIGGLVGYLQGNSIISDSYSNGVIGVNSTTDYSGSLSIGGLVGAVAYTGQPTVFAINNSYSSTNLLVSGENAGVVSVGGFIGANGVAAANPQASNISDSYSTGYVNSAVNSDGGISNVGGFIGFEGSNVRLHANFWDTGTSGMMQDKGIGNNYGVVIGLTAGCFSGACGDQGGKANLSASSTYANAGWDTSVWGIIDAHSYAYLSSFYPDTPEVISGSTPATGNSQVKLVADGAVIDSIATGANGFYYSLQAAGTIPGNTAVLAFVDGINANNVFVTPASGSGGLSGINLVTNTITLGGDYASTVSNNDFVSALGNYSNPSIMFSVVGADLTLGTDKIPNIELVSSPATSFALDGSLISAGHVNVATNLILSGEDMLSTKAVADTMIVTGKIDSATASHANLTLEGPGEIVLSGAVGSVNALENFTANTNLEVNANVITTAGKQNYAGSVLFTAPVSLIGVEFSFAGALAGGNNVSITGASSSGNNSLSYASNSQGVNVILNTAVNSGSIVDLVNGNSMGSFSNINQVTGNSQSTLQLPATERQLTLTGSNSGFVNDPINFSQFSNFVNPNNASSVVFDTPAAQNANTGQVLVNGTPIELLGFEAQSFSGDITIETDAPSGINASSKHQLDQNDLAILRSYTNYVNNVPPTPAPTLASVYTADNSIVVQQVASNCSTTMQNASVDMENNITLSESCAP